MLQINQLFNFQKPRPFAKLKYFVKEQKTGEWSVENGFKISTLEIVSWSLFEINK